MVEDMARPGIFPELRGGGARSGPPHILTRLDPKVARGEAQAPYHPHWRSKWIDLWSSYYYCFQNLALSPIIIDKKQREAAKKFFIVSGQSIKGFSPPPPPLGLVVKRTAICI